MIPLALTTITVRRIPVDPARDPYDAEPEPFIVASGVRAVISSPSARSGEVLAGGSQEHTYFSLACDPVDLTHRDRVLDDRTGEEYEVEWARTRNALGGLDHTQAALYQIRGIPS